MEPEQANYDVSLLFSIKDVYDKQTQ